MNLLTWLGIALCISQSAMLSGLNLAFFTITKLNLEMENAKGNKHARRVLAMRNDANFLLVTILWGNVSVNVLLALLSESILTGAMAFVFSTVVITMFGEILPQAYCSRHGLQMASLLSPILRFYQLVLYPVAKPTALLLDKWLGPEGVKFFREKEIKELIKMHMDSPTTEIDDVEGHGAMNFLAIDDVTLASEGEPLDTDSIITLDYMGGVPIFPSITPSSTDPFLVRINRSRRKWVVILDPKGEPRTVLNSNQFIRDAFFDFDRFNPYRHCRRPIVERDANTKLGDIIPRFRVTPVHSEDDVVDEDLILLWDKEKRIVTGADVLGRLLRGIVQNPVVPILKSAVPDKAADVPIKKSEPTVR